jgi:hypothetical protein
MNDEVSSVDDAPQGDRELLRVSSPDVTHPGTSQLGVAKRPEYQATTQPRAEGSPIR